MSLPPSDSERTSGEHWAKPSRFRGAREIAVRVFLMFCAAVTVLTTIGIVAVLGVETVRFFAGSGVGPLQFLLGSELDPDGNPPRFGILPLIYGTFVIAAGASAIALPIGLLSAIYLSEYAPRRVRAILKPTLELLAGVPSIVYGYLALLLVTPALKLLLEPRFKVESYNVLSACIVVGIMIIPMVSSLSEDILSAVPRSLREAAYALGATKFEVSTRIVLPAGLSGVMAAFILTRPEIVPTPALVQTALKVNDLKIDVDELVVVLIVGTHVDTLRTQSDPGPTLAFVDVPTINPNDQLNHWEALATND